MKILALDSATQSCSVALWADGSILASRSELRARGQAECLVPMIDAAMAAAGLDFVAIDRIAVTIGPGHFTGLRVGLATARGLALAMAKPLVGVTTLEAVAAAVPAEERATRKLIVALDSKRDELYLQSFAADLVPLDRPLACVAQDYAARKIGSSSWLIVGDGAMALLGAMSSLGIDARLSSASGLPDAGIVAKLAAGREPPAVAPDALYLHPAAVTVAARIAHA